MKSLSSAMKPMSVIKRIIAMKMLFVITQLEAMNASASQIFKEMEKTVPVRSVGILISDQ